MTSSGNTVSAISARTNTITATIPAGSGPFIAANPRTNKIYEANSEDNTVSVLRSCPH